MDVLLRGNRHRPSAFRRDAQFEHLENLMPGEFPSIGKIFGALAFKPARDPRQVFHLAGVLEDPGDRALLLAVIGGAAKQGLHGVNVVFLERRRLIGAEDAALLGGQSGPPGFVALRDGGAV